VSKAIPVTLLLILALTACVGTEVTGAVVDTAVDGNTYGARVLQLDGSTRDIRITMFVYNDITLAHVYRFWCNQDGPYCRASELLYTQEWVDAVDKYIKDHLDE
jgi:hypothetical protein